MLYRVVDGCYYRVDVGVHRVFRVDEGLAAGVLIGRNGNAIRRVAGIVNGFVISAAGVVF